MPTLCLVLLEHDGVEPAAPLVEGVEPLAEPDDVLARLPENGGVCMITFVPFFVNPDAYAWSLEVKAAAEAAGVFDEVMASLDASERNAGWAERVAYNRERMETHGLRRAAEMEESARTLQGLDVEPVMTRGTIVLQRRAAKRKFDKGTQAA